MKPAIQKLTDISGYIDTIMTYVFPLQQKELEIASEAEDAVLDTVSNLWDRFTNILPGGEYLVRPYPS